MSLLAFFVTNINKGWELYDNYNEDNDIER